MALRSGHGAFQLASLALSALGATGCYRVPEGKTAVSAVEIVGTRNVDDEAIQERLATRESSRFLGLFPGFVYEYEVFDLHALQRDLSRIERYLRARGYYDARVQATRIETVSDKVRVTIEIVQGPAMVVSSMTVFGDESAQKEVREAVRARIKEVLPLGSPLDEEKLAEAEKAALDVLTADGYAAAKVTRSAEVDLASRTARMTFEIEPGRIARYGRITFEGLGDELPENAVRRVFGLEEGEEFSSEDLETAQQALLALGVFASVHVDLDLEEAKRSGVVPVSVKCEPSKLRAVVFGGGIEFDALKTDVHAVTGWQNANFLGGLRKLDLRFKPGIVLYPTRTTVLEAPEHPLYEHRLNASLRQPALFEKRTTGVAFAEYSVFPVLLPVPTENVLGYHETRGEVGVERPFGRLFVSPQYGLQANFPIDYIGQTTGVETLLLSYVELFTYLDLRDHPLKPRRGVRFGADMQTAGGPLQGDAHDVKLQPDVRVFVPLPKKTVLALRSAVGFLFPFNYAQTPPYESRDYQILFFRGFFGGGPTSNRGYPLRAIGPHEVIPYLSPAGQSAIAGVCDPTDPGCVLPTGGLSLWELNAEVRFIVAAAFSSAVFCDAGDVSPFRVDIRLDRPHLSCGAGARYDTPVGPIRLDVGYRIPGLQFASGASGERPPPELLGMPIAIALAIGEAF